MSGLFSSTAKWLEPESNQPSSVSVSFVKVFPPQCGQTKPSGINSEASFSYHELEPSFAKISETEFIVSSVHTGFLQVSQ